jgi:hypothetical protein
MSKWNLKFLMIFRVYILKIKCQSSISKLSNEASKLCWQKRTLFIESYLELIWWFEKFWKESFRESSIVYMYFSKRFTHSQYWIKELDLVKYLWERKVLKRKSIRMSFCAKRLKILSSLREWFYIARKNKNKQLI